METDDLIEPPIVEADTGHEPTIAEPIADIGLIAPTPIGVGLDLVDVDRVERALARTPGLVTRLFTPRERAYCESGRAPTARAQRFAARFAAKEAVMKALGVGLGGIGWRDVEVRRADDGRPSLWVTGRAAELATLLGVAHWSVSLTHTATVAGAVVVASGRGNR